MDVLLIVFLTLLNGVFAMSELALASSRKSRLAAMAEGGDKGAQAALTLLDNPTQFLSSVPLASATRTDRIVYSNGRLYVSEPIPAGVIHVLRIVGGKQA